MINKDIYIALNHSPIVQNYTAFLFFLREKLCFNFSALRTSLKYLLLWALAFKIFVRFVLSMTPKITCATTMIPNTKDILRHDLGYGPSNDQLRLLENGYDCMLCLQPKFRLYNYK